MRLFLAFFDWPHAVTILAALIAAAVALWPHRRARRDGAAEPVAGRLANIETRLGCVESEIQQTRSEVNTQLAEIRGYLLDR